MWKLFKTRASEGFSEARLNELTAQIRDQEARLKSVEMEWAAVYKKFSRLAGHITKSAALDAALEAAPLKPKNNDAHELTRDEIANMRV